MSEERPTITSSRLTATEVARHNFGTVRRGLDAQEVRAYLELVARDMQAWEQREQELRQQIAELAEQVRHPVLDEATLTAALGQQSALVLRNAHDEAARVTADAEERAAALAREAQSLAAESSVRAETSAAERIAEAELAVSGVREQAKAEAQAIVDAARHDAEELAARAREHGRHLVEEAQAARKRVLADLAQRRHALHVQIEQLRAARDLLTASVLGVREQVDSIADDLSRADERARAAAVDVGRRAGADEALAPDDVLADEETDLPDLAVAGPAPDDGGGQEPAAPPAARGGRGDQPAPAGSASADPSGARADQPGNRPAGSVPSGEALTPPAVSVLEEPTAEVPATPTPPSAPGAAGDGEPAAGADAGDAAGEGGSIDSRSLEELFARIRASQRAASEEPGPGGAPADPGSGGEGAAEPVLPSGDTPPAATAASGVVEPPSSAASAPDAAPGDTDAPDAAPGGTDAPDAAPGDTDAPDAAPGGTEPGSDDEDQALLAHRDEVLAPIVANLSRRLKRALADDQNGLLDRLRASGGAWSDDALPTEEDHTAALAAVALEPLQEATAAGQALAAELGGASRRRARPVPVEGIAEELGLTVVRLLRRRLPGGADGPAAADVDEASDAVGAAYRAWRGQRIEDLVGDFALGAMGAGIVAAGGQRHLRWVVGGQGNACADCDDNSLAGAIAAGEEFPTGHAYPPAHAGCRCLIVPAPT